ncbi:MAG TPA: hypothetical protein VF593_11205 [Chthoniobacteraceae bacterium]|jgi:hypothetical protein
MKHSRLLLLIVIFVSALTAAQGQVAVDLHIKRRMLIAHEPIVATVTVTNLTGRDITLADTAEMQWFGFQVNTTGDRIVPPRNPNYALPPLIIKAGGQMRRTVNLNELYEIGDYGIYRIRANIHFAELGKFFSSRPSVVEVTEGRLLWKQVAGVPGSSELRKFSLLAHQQGNYTLAYVRVEDRENGTVFITQELGRMIEGNPPIAELDLGNNLFVLQLVGQREYLLSRISPNGEFLGQTRYSAPKSKPFIRRLEDGQLQLVGGRRMETIAQNPAAAPATKLSERPVGMPKN